MKKIGVVLACGLVFGVAACGENSTERAVPGDRLEYHRGFLGIDTTAVISTLPEPERRRLGALASAAYRAFDAAMVHLVQVRVGPDRFAYLAIARTKPRHAPVSFTQLIATEEAA